MNFNLTTPGPIGSTIPAGRIRLEVSQTYDESNYIGFKLPTEPLKTMEFFVSGKTIGSIYFGPPMRFEGDAEESAKVFFQYLTKLAV